MPAVDQLVRLRLLAVCRYLREHHNYQAVRCPKLALSGISDYVRIPRQSDEHGDDCAHKKQDETHSEHRNQRLYAEEQCDSIQNGHGNNSAQPRFAAFRLIMCVCPERWQRRSVSVQVVVVRFLLGQKIRAQSV